MQASHSLFAFTAISVQLSRTIERLNTPLTLTCDVHKLFCPCHVTMQINFEFSINKYAFCDDVFFLCRVISCIQSVIQPARHAYVLLVLISLFFNDL